MPIGPNTHQTWTRPRIELIPLLEDTVAGARQSYLLLFGAVGCVLLVACTNISNLLLARFAARRKEIAAQFVLGASRADVVRQLLAESLSVSILGGLLGLLLAVWALKAIVAIGGPLIHERRRSDSIPSRSSSRWQ